MAFLPQTFLLVLPVKHLPKHQTSRRLAVNVCKEVLNIFKSSYSTAFYFWSATHVCVTKFSFIIVSGNSQQQEALSKAPSQGRIIQFSEPTLLQLIYSGDGRVKDM